MRTPAKIALVLATTVLASFVAVPAWAAFWVSLGPFGGSVDSVVVDATNARVLYAILNSQDAFKSTDGGASWTFMHDEARSIALDPSRPDKVYLAAAARLLKSSDGGRHWTAVKALDRSSVTAVAVDPWNPSRLYAGGWFGDLLYSTDRGTSWTPSQAPLSVNTGKVKAIVPALPNGRVFALTEGGLLRSTDGGLSWDISGEGLPAGAPLAFAVDPADPQSVYVSLSDGLFRSADGGTSWVRTLGQPAGSGTVLSLAVSSQGLWAGAEPKGLFLSKDKGATWSAAGPPRRVTAVAIAPSSPRTIYLGTTAEGDFLGGIFVSANGGAKWERRNQGLTGLAVKSLETSPAIPGWLWIVVSNQGLFQSLDGGQSWTRASLRPSLSGDLKLASSPADALLLYAYSLPRIWQTLDGGLSWREIPGQPGSPRPTFELRADPADPLKLWGLGGGLLLSRDSGATWSKVSIPTAFYCSGATLAIAPSSPSALYVGGSVNTGNRRPECRYTTPVVLRSRDGGATWTTFTGPAGSYVSLLAVDPLDSRIVYAGTSPNTHNIPPSGLFKSEDSGMAWSRIGDFSLGPISALLVLQDEVLWVAYDHYLGLKVVRSGDAGATWQDKKKNLRTQTVYEFAADPNERRIYAATANGVWVLTEPD